MNAEKKISTIEYMHFKNNNKTYTLYTMNQPKYLRPHNNN